MYRLTFEPIDVTETGDREADVDRIVADTAVLERWVGVRPSSICGIIGGGKQRPHATQLGDPL